MFEKTIAFLWLGMIGALVTLLMQLPFVMSVVVGLLAGTITVLCLKYLNGDFDKRPKSRGRSNL